MTSSDLRVGWVVTGIFGGLALLVSGFIACLVWGPARGEAVVTGNGLDPPLTCQVGEMFRPTLADAVYLCVESNRWRTYKP